VSELFDDIQTFDYDYFGARYYDSRIGQFSSVDAAGQFASGYVYGANNPVMGVDRDGNFFFIPGLLAAAGWGALFSAGTAAITSTITGDWSNFGKSVLAGAISGGVGYGLSFAGSAVGAVTAGNKAAFGVLNNIGSTAATAGIMGQKLSWQSIAGSVAGSVTSSEMFGQYKGTSGGWLKNVVKDATHGAFSGATSGIVGGMTTNLLSKRNLTAGLDQYYKYGALGGASSSLWKSALIGASRPVSSNADIQQKLKVGAQAYGTTSTPNYRSGGLWKALGIRDFAGFGNEIIVNSEEDSENWVHETVHFWQYTERGYGRSLDRLSWEQTRSTAGDWGFRNYYPYTSEGAMEWEAEFITRRLYGEPY
jgi:hypothetical protein